MRVLYQLFSGCKVGTFITDSLLIILLSLSWSSVNLPTKSFLLSSGKKIRTFFLLLEEIYGGKGGRFFRLSITFLTLGFAKGNPILSIVIGAAAFSYLHFSFLVRLTVPYVPKSNINPKIIFCHFLFDILHFLIYGF